MTNQDGVSEKVTKIILIIAVIYSLHCLSGLEVTVCLGKSHYTYVQSPKRQEP